MIALTYEAAKPRKNFCYRQGKKNRNKGYDVLELGQIAFAAQRIGDKRR
jgi:hypothetical protein